MRSGRPDARTLVPTLILILVYLFVLAFTRPVNIADSHWYVADIESALRTSDRAPLWEFAHLLWRPLGAALYGIAALTGLPHIISDTQYLLYTLFCTLNVLACLFLPFLVYSSVALVSKRRRYALLAAIGLLGAAAVINYSRSASPYLTGTALSYAAFYVGLRSPKNGFIHRVMAGALAGLAALLWIPFVLCIPLVMLGPSILASGEPFCWRRVLKPCIITGAVAAAVMLAGYAAGAAIHDISSVDHFIAWARGASLDERSLNWLRVASGFTRTYYELGDSPVLIKWLLFNDPFARATAADLFASPLIALPLSFLGSAALAAAAWLSSDRWRWLAILMLGVAPHVALGALYEGGSGERYLAAAPVVLFCCGCLAAARSRHYIGSTALGLFLIPWAFNGYFLNRHTVGKGVEKLQDRLRVLQQVAGPRRVIVISTRDPLARLSNYPELWRAAAVSRDVYVLQPVGKLVPFWREEAACVIENSWRQAQEVWVTARVFAEEPRREWLWVEGDDPRFRWRDIHSFFGGFRRGSTIGGDDGFVQLPPSNENQALAQSLLGERGFPGCLERAR